MQICGNVNIAWRLIVRVSFLFFSSKWAFLSRLMSSVATVKSTTAKCKVKNAWTLLNVQQKSINGHAPFKQLIRKCRRGTTAHSPHAAPCSNRAGTPAVLDAYLAKAPFALETSQALRSWNHRARCLCCFPKPSSLIFGRTLAQF